MARTKNTRAASGTGTIRQRSNGRWEARITVGVDPGTGKPIRKSIYGATQKEVRQAMTAALRDLDNGTYRLPNKITVGQWFDQWLENFCTNTVKPLTYTSYQGTIKNHIKPTIGALRLQEIKGSHIQKLYNTMTDKGLSAKTVKNAAAILHKGFSVAVKQHMIAFNPCDSAELPKGEKRTINPLTDEEIPRFLAAIESHRYRNAYALCLFAGLREGECLGLSWKQVDFQRGRLTISQQLQHEKKTGVVDYIAESTKSGKPRVIEPPRIAFDYLRAERVRQTENRLKAGEAWSNSDDLVFTDESGKHIPAYMFYRKFKKLATSIGRPDARPHDLRHTAATVAIAAGADIKSVQDLLGHATASFTLNTYAHTSERMMKDTAERMQNYYASLNKKRA